MKRQFLVITSNRSVSTIWEKREAYVKEFYAQLETKVDNVEVRYTTYNDITYLVRGKKVRIYDTRHQVDLKDVDAVHFKNWMLDREQAATIAAYLRRHGVTFFNQEVDSGQASGKLSQMFYLAMAKLPVPDTYFARKPQLIKDFQQESLPPDFKFPLILKDNDGAKGEDNHLVTSSQQAIKILQAAPAEMDFVVQNFLPNDGDLRFLFMGFDQEPLVFRREALAGTHLNNTSMGGQGSFVDLGSLPTDYLGIARQAAQILHREISGVDLLVDKNTERVYILEVNYTPALATGYGVDRKNDQFAQFLQQQLAAPSYTTKKPVIGRAEPISFKEGEVHNLTAKIDTGAYRSSVWATDIEERDGMLYFTLLGPASPCYSGQQLKTKRYQLVEVENSFGHKEQRYSVFLKVEIAGRKIRSNFTLSNRASKTYSVLIGRKLLKNRFIVDVSTGKPVEDEEINGDDSLA
jgi:glutathione synthase/RimK-type ligase-like ATP-grasp enzyme